MAIYNKDTVKLALTIKHRLTAEKGEEVMTHQEIKEMLEKQLQLLFEHSSGSEDRDLIGLTSEMCEIIRILLTI